jgi:hypothetical protein
MMYILAVTFEHAFFLHFSISVFQHFRIFYMPNPISPLISSLENPADLNLDQLLELLRDAARIYENMYVRATFYEKELQRELKSLLELTGPIPACAEPQLAYTLQTEALLLARRDARKLFNEIYKIAPVRRGN